MSHRLQVLIPSDLAVAVMLNHGIEVTATYDAGFDGVAGIRRLKLR